jgi:hypothetical protein
MSAQEQSRKAIISVAEMATAVGLSRSRFYTMMQAGIFPKPVQKASGKRPVFDLELQHKCLEIRRSGIGMNGEPVLFNRKRRTQKSRPSGKPSTNDHADIVEAIRSLGISTSSEIVEEALRSLYPEGWSQIDQGELVRQVFLYVQRKR